MMYSEKKTYWKEIFLIDKFLKKLLRYNREKIHQIFLTSTIYNSDTPILDVGTSNTFDDNHNILLQKTKNNKNIDCLSDQDLTKLISEKYSHVRKFIHGSGTNIDLKNNLYDTVYCSATIEHVGCFKNQIKLIEELYRVSKNYVFITTPNKHYPIDFHTKLPLIHWLPKKIHRKILKFLGLDFYSLEENLNLLNKKELHKIMIVLKIINYKIISFKFLFFTSNLILVIKK
jgi:hypothetical protein